MNTPTTQPTPPHPGRLVLGFGLFLCHIHIHPQDPHELLIDAKPGENIDQIIQRSISRTLGRAIRVVAPRDTTCLVIGRTTIALQPHHIEPATAWCAAYTAWLQNGDLKQVAA
jgi:hypothetical protein